MGLKINNNNLINFTAILSANNFPTNKTAIANTMSNFDTFINTQTSTIPDNYHPEAQEPISPEDAVYLNALRMPDGSEIRFPPDNAPLAAKKAWIEAMKKLTSEQRAFAQAKILFPNVYDPELTTSISDYQTLIQNKIASISSYQTLFRDFKTDMERKLHGTKSLEGKRECQEMIQAWDTLLVTFAKYKIK